MDNGNVDVTLKNFIYVKKDYIWSLVTCSCKNGKYLACIIGDSVITCNEITDAGVEAKSYVEEPKIIPKKLSLKQIIYIFYFSFYRLQLNRLWLLVFTVT